MREIITGKLWIGNAKDGRDLMLSLDAGIGAVINLALEELPPVLPRNLIYCHFPIIDGVQEHKGALDSAIQTLASLLKNQVPVLVHCSFGMSRSPAVAAAALAIVEGDTPEEHLRRIVADNPHDVSPQLWKSIKDILAS